MTSLNHYTEDLTKTPEEMLQLFYENHNLDKIKITLWELLQGYSLNDKKGFLKLDIDAEQIADVIDSLVGLVKTVETLKKEGKIQGIEA